MMDKLLKQQVEQILDEGTGKYRNIIVQMASPTKDSDPLLRAATDAAKRRTLALTARDILPLPLNKMRFPKSGKRSRAERGELRAAAKSLAAQLAADFISAMTRSVLKASGLKTVQPLLHSDLVLRSIEKMLKPKTKSKKEILKEQLSLISSQTKKQSKAKTKSKTKSKNTKK